MSHFYPFAHQQSRKLPKKAENTVHDAMYSEVHQYTDRQEKNADYFAPTEFFFSAILIGFVFIVFLCLYHTVDYEQITEINLMGL